MTATLNLAPQDIFQYRTLTYGLVRTQYKAAETHTRKGVQG